MSEVEGISELVLAAQGKPVVFEAPEGRTFVAVPRPEGAYHLEQITSPNKAEVLLPKVVAQHVKVQTSESMMDYVNRFKNEDTVIFADVNSNSVQAIVDYHRKPAGTDPNPKATLGIHRATLNLPFSLEWQTWMRASGKLVSHLEFATFLEENAIDVKNPVGADLLELCRDLQVASNVNFSSSVRMGDVTKFEFQKDNDAKTRGDIALPASIMLSIPVYFGENPVPVMAYMRRKITDGSLYLGVQLSRAENVRQDEFHRIVDSIMENTGSLTTVYGTPA